MVWETFCIVFIWFVVNQFYPKSCNFKGVLSMFSEKSCNRQKQDIKWRIEDMKIEDLSKCIWRQYRAKKFHLKFQGIARQKNTWKRVKNCRIRIGGVVSCTPVHEPFVTARFSLVLFLIIFICVCMWLIALCVFLVGIIKIRCRRVF